MEITYASKKMEKSLQNERVIRKYYGNYSIKIIHRLSELMAANNLGEIPDVPPPRRHKLRGEYAGCWGIDYSANYRIVIRPTGKFNPNDLSSIESIEIVDLVDYH